MAQDEQKTVTSSVCRIITFNRRDIHNVNYREKYIFWDGCQMDIVNNSDTHCFGRRFCPIDFKYQQFTVSPLLEKYPEQINAPIFSAGTIYTLGSGEMVILVFELGLWFGNCM